MASTGKTPKLGLNQWAGSDDVLRSDFNRDNVKIDEGVVAAEALAEKSRVVTGSYVGNNVDNREIDLGFSPRFLFLQFTTGNPYGSMIFAFPGMAMIVSTNDTGILTDANFCITPTGFMVSKGYYGNYTGQTMRYFAIR